MQASRPPLAQELLKDFDVDSDGLLTSAELSRAATLLKEEKSKTQRLRCQLRAAIATAVALIVLLVTANLFTSILAEKISRELYVSRSSALTNAQGRPVGVSTMEGRTRLADLPGSQINLSALKNIRLDGVDGSHSYYNVLGFTWHNTTSMELYLTMDLVLHIHDGSVLVESLKTDLQHPGRRHLVVCKRALAEDESHRNLSPCDDFMYEGDCFWEKVMMEEKDCASGHLGYC